MINKSKKINILKETKGLWVGRKDIRMGVDWVNKNRKKEAAAMLK